MDNNEYLKEELFGDDYDRFEEFNEEDFA